MSFRGKDRGSVYEDFTNIVETTWPSPKTSDGGCALDLIGTLTKRRENLVVGMGGSDSKLNFRKAVVQLTTKKTVRQNVMIRFRDESFQISHRKFGVLSFAPDQLLGQWSRTVYTDFVFRLWKQPMTRFGSNFGQSHRRI